MYRKTSARGFTLIETLISMIVLLLAILGMLSVIPFGFRSVQTDAVHAQAVAVGQQYLDGERNMLLQGLPAPAATTVPIDPGQSYIAHGMTNSGYGNFSVSPDGCASVQNSGSTKSAVNVYSCSVTVSWTQGGAPKSVTVQSYAIASK